MALFKRLRDRLTCRLAGSRKHDEARYGCSTPSITSLHSENPNVPSHPDRKCYRVSGLNLLWSIFNLEMAMQTEALDPEGIGGEIVALLPEPTENPTNASQTDAGLAYETTSCRPLPRQKHKLHDDHHLIPRVPTKTLRAQLTTQKFPAATPAQISPAPSKEQMILA